MIRNCKIKYADAVFTNIEDKNLYLAEDRPPSQTDRDDVIDLTTDQTESPNTKNLIKSEKLTQTKVVEFDEKDYLVKLADCPTGSTLTEADYIKQVKQHSHLL